MSKRMTFGIEYTRFLEDIRVPQRLKGSLPASAEFENHLRMT